MEEKRCPFCWDENVRHIADIKFKKCIIVRPLMACDCCEKHFWGDTGEKVVGLSKFCHTLSFNPEKCDESIQNIMNMRNFKLDRRKIEELDLLCGSCPQKKFVLNGEMISHKTLHR